ncbi:MAG: NADH:ubiquinone reductase (Na(+)-transporting) subunit B [Bacteroidales bacterium]|nr:NADH:ubiquinone reductase (Na(+)-transporting) subunit B [Bacteroidales bacterium]
MNAIFEKGGKLYWLHSTVDAFDTFLKVPGTVSGKGASVRDAIDLKRIMIMVVIAAVPAALFGMWNVGYQHNLTLGDGRIQILANFWYGFLRVLPLYLVSYIVGLAIEFAASQIRGEEVNEGYLVSGFLIPLILPVTTPLWMVAIATAFSVFFVKECFGGTGMNIWNPALVARAFLFFAYPNQMSGSQVWISNPGPDAVTGATPLALDGAAQYGTGFWDLFIGTVPGSVGETSVIAILLGAAILLWTGVASWRIMLSSVIGALFVGGIGQLTGITGIACWEHLLLGGFAFGTVFMATDPVTSAQTNCGKWIYGFLIGALCVTVRLFNPGYAEGMMLAILLMNMFAPLIDHCVVTAKISSRAKKMNRI